MRTKSIAYVFVLFSVVILACGITVNLPVDRIVTGETRTEDIVIPIPQASSTELHISFGAGELAISGTAVDNLLEGVATYNVADFKPVLEEHTGYYLLESGRLDLSGFPRLDEDVVNKWDLQLADFPLALKITAGAYQGRYVFGGLSIRSLEVQDGAADVRMDFSAPNKVDMDTFKYTTGASNVHLSGLLNANFATMFFRGGAGNYTLDFSGEMQREAMVVIESGISHVVIIVPQDVNVIVDLSGGLTQVSTSGNWEETDGKYTISADTPLLTIHVEMGAGNLELQAK